MTKMTKMTRWLAFLLAMLMLIAACLSCAQEDGLNDDDDDDDDDEKDFSEYEGLSPEEVYKALLEADYCVYELKTDRSDIEVTVAGKKAKAQVDSDTVYFDFKKQEGYYQENGVWLCEPLDGDAPQDKEELFEELFGEVLEFQNADVEMLSELLFDDSNYTSDDGEYVIRESVAEDYFAEADDVSIVMKSDETAYTFHCSVTSDGEEYEWKLKVEFKSTKVKLPDAKDAPQWATTAVTTIPQATTTARPIVTTPRPIVTTPPIETEPPIEYEMEYPYLYDNWDSDRNLSRLLDDKTCVNYTIDSDSFASSGFSRWSETEDVPQLFDGIKTYEDFEAAGLGKMGGVITGYGAYFFWSTTVPVKVSAYVITTGNDTLDYPERNPIAWYLYGTNDSWAASWAQEYGELDEDEWTVLDYVYDGNITYADFMENGYAVDEENQGEYQYYCWMIEYTSYNVFQAGEFELYVDDEDDPYHASIAETPYLRESVEADYDLDTMLEGKTLVTDRIDHNSLASIGFTPWNTDFESVPQMFDGIKTYEDFEAAGLGKMGGAINGYGAYFFWATDMPVKVSAYVITTGNDNSTYPGRNPVAWSLYATNDFWAIQWAQEYGEFDKDQWVELDYVYDGNMTDADFMENGYAVDAARQGEYQYYCWYIEYTWDNVVQLCEFELYE